MRKFRRILALLCVSVTLSGAVGTALASKSTEIDALNAQINAQKQKVSSLDSLIKTTQSNIVKRQSEEQTLENEIAILENRVREKELDIERTQAEIQQITLEIDLTNREIELHGGRIETQKNLVAALVRRMYQEDTTTPLDVILSNGTLSDAFARFEETRKVQRDLESTLARVRDEKKLLEERKQMKVEKQNALETARKSLRKEMLALEAEQNFKISLIAETKDKEQEYQRILYELRQQQQSTTNDISELEEKLQQQLRSVDEVLASGDTILAWPVNPSRGITAIFHDPTYPFRAVFEHPGEDIRVNVGTPIQAAGGGYVAWNKTGRMYGNYLMLVHTGGIATVYAHLSKFIAKPDSFVERGETIGLSGGKPGTPGAGLSTGPHLHFEVRKDGIPVDPEKYLPNIPNDYYDYYDEYKALKIRL